MSVVMVILFILRNSFLPVWTGFGLIPEDAGFFIPLNDDPSSLAPVGSIRFIYNLTQPICLIVTLGLSILASLKVFHKLPDQKKFLISVTTISVYSLLLGWVLFEIFRPIF